MVILVNKRVEEEDGGDHSHDENTRFIEMCNALDRMLAALKFGNDQLDILKDVIDDYRRVK